MHKNISTRASKKENEPKIIEKRTKSRAGRLLKLILKRQKEAKSAKVLITELILLLERN